MAFLTGFSVIRPTFEYSQEQALHWIAKAHQVSQSFASSEDQGPKFHAMLLQRLLKVGLGSKKIEKRGTVVPDYTHDNFNAMEIYEITSANRQGKDLKVRSAFFEKCADHVFEKFYANAPLADHLLQVTCTGYAYPSAAQKIASKKNAFNTTITNVFHMGCYAAIPAIRIAAGMIGNDETADIIHTEMCSLHMNPELHDIEQLVVQTLFADGFIKYTLSNQAKKGFEMIASHEILIPDSISSMSWKQEHWGMKMHIAKTVPIVIRQQLRDFIHALFKKAHMPSQDAHYAIHPGGPKIIDEIAEELALSEFKIKHSRDILRNCGNMSSATLPHVWDAILKDHSVQEGSLVVSLAFGPGLTVAGALMRKI